MTEGVQAAGGGQKTRMFMFQGPGRFVVPLSGAVVASEASCFSCRDVPCPAQGLCRQHLLQQGQGLAAADTECVAHP